jgi:hypothetical protein
MRVTDGETSMTAANDLAVRPALELAGIEFIDENGGGSGCVSTSVNEQNHPNSHTVSPMKSGSGLCL